MKTHKWFCIIPITYTSVKYYFNEARKSQVSMESCPVNCIHWVETEDLPTLEFLMQPQPKEGYGIFGGGWERPSNVFTAAKSFNKQLKGQATTRPYERTGRNSETS